MKKLTLKSRLRLLVAMYVLSIILIEGFGLFRLKQLVTEDYQHTLTNLVDTAASIISTKSVLVEEGHLPLTEAQARSILLVSNMLFESQRAFWIIDNNTMTVLAAPSMARLEQQAINSDSSEAGKTVFRDAYPLIQQNDKGITSIYWHDDANQHQTQRVAVFKNAPEFDWTIGASIDASEVHHAYLEEAIYQSLFIAVFTTALAIGLSLIIRSIRKPINHAAHIADCVASGNYHCKLEKPGTRDSIGRLLDSLDQMRVSLQASDEAKDRLHLIESSRIRQALDDVSTGVIVTDENGDIIYVNAAFEKGLGQYGFPFNSRTLIGKSLTVLHSDWRSLVNLKKAQRLELHSGVFSIIVNHVLDPEDKHVGFVVEIIDLTEQFNIEDQVQKVVRAARDGDLGQTIPLEGKHSFFLSLSASINDVVNVNDQIINDANRVLGAISQGDLSQRIVGDYQGQFKKLQHFVNDAAEKLTEMILEIRGAADNVACGATEISRNNAMLYDRSDAQAEALESSSAAVTEITESVKQTAANTDDVTRAAADAAGSAKNGVSVVRDAIVAMNEISESSHKMATIISSIDEIAFQTSLLSLNAAVEAARAGEQGKGFAVVANEVRNLAQRTAESAKEIEFLIKETLTRVETGTMLTNSSGEALNGVESSFNQVNELISSIAEAAREQSIAIERVAHNMNDMDHGTQQTTSMVQQITQESEALEKQALELNALVSYFYLPSDGPVAKNRADAA